MSNVERVFGDSVGRIDTGEWIMSIAIVLVCVVIIGIQLLYGWKHSIRDERP